MRMKRWSQWLQIGVFVLFFGSRREKEYADNLPFCFRILQTETKFLSRTLGREIVVQMPSLERYWNNQILLSGLKLEPSDIFGSRIFWCLLFALGGILGGRTSGMPVEFRVAFRPTPTIFKPQKSVDLGTMKETVISVPGRHDPCVVPRAVPCIEAACAIALANLIV